MLNQVKPLGAQLRDALLGSGGRLLQVITVRSRCGVRERQRHRNDARTQNKKIIIAETDF